MWDSCHAIKSNVNQGTLFPENKRSKNGKSHFIFVEPSFKGTFGENLVMDHIISLQPVPNNFRNNKSCTFFFRKHRLKTFLELVFAEFSKLVKLQKRNYKFNDFLLIPFTIGNLIERNKLLQTECFVLWIFPKCFKNSMYVLRAFVSAQRALSQKYRQ